MTLSRVMEGQELEREAGSEMMATAKLLFASNVASKPKVGDALFQNGAFNMCVV